MRRIVSVFAVAAALFTIGCASIGPANVTRDRFDYVIEDRDRQSKQMLNFLMFLFSLTDTGTAQAAPIVTIPAR